MKNKLRAAIKFLMSLVGLYVNFDKGHGSDTGRWLYISIFGGGKLRPWWSNLNDGPGNAREPGKDCGHKFPRHCNSAHCGQRWCNAQKWRVFTNLFIVGHSFRLWCGPTYGRTLKDWKIGFRSLRNKRRCYTPGDSLYSWISFR